MACPYNIESCGDVVKLLSSLKETDRHSILPDGLKVDIRGHSTATECKIYLVGDGLTPLLVWYKTNWISSRYEFNENGKIIGLQPDCEFIRSVLKKFFNDALVLKQCRLQEKEDAIIEEQKALDEQKQELLEAHKKLWLGKEEKE
jgi:hypothetical protein